MCVGIPANLIMILTIFKNRSLLLQPTNLFLLNMCISDLLNLSVSPILFLFNQDVIFRFYYLGDFLCNIGPFLIGEILVLSSTEA